MERKRQQTDSTHQISEGSVAVITQCKMCQRRLMPCSYAEGNYFEIIIS